MTSSRPQLDLFAASTWQIRGFNLTHPRLQLDTSAASTPVECSTVRLHCTTTRQYDRTHEPPYNCTTVRQYYRTTELLNYRTTELPYYCARVRLYNCISFRSCLYTAVLPYDCATVQLSTVSPVPPQGCTTVPQYYRATRRLRDKAGELPVAAR